MDGWRAGIGVGFRVAFLIGAAACSPDAVSTGMPDAATDSGTDANPNGSTFTLDAAPEAAAVDGGVSCVPIGFDAPLPPFVPPIAPRSVCTPAQILAYYNACFTGAGGTVCSDFDGDPANSPCIECMYWSSTASSWGPVIQYMSEDVLTTNVGGCIALVDGDGGAGSCGPAVQALDVCEHEACANCPSGATPAGFTAFQTCETLSRATTCSAYLAPAQCAQAAQYVGCSFVNFESAFRGIGQVMCAAGVDAGSTLDAGADAAEE